MTERSGGSDVDVVVVGAGMAGLYLLHRLRQSGFTAMAFEAADDVGGTWYWNRYPGARCDVQSVDYSYSFDPDLERDWVWSEKYATQPEILRYLQHVADRYDLRRDIAFSTRIADATWDEGAARWTIRTDAGDEVSCRFYVMATGCLSAPKDPDIAGVARFGGDVYFTSHWPHEGVDFTGQRVAVIGTGSSGIQSIPIIAEQAAQLTVFQRTANFSVPAHNGPIPTDKLSDFQSDPAAYRNAARWSLAGVPIEPAEESALQVDDDERQRRFEAAWAEGTLFALMGSFNDILINPAANDTVAEFVRTKIRSIVDDPDTAASLSSQHFPIGTKRLCLDSGYYETFNRDHVRLVDLRRDPIASITETGIDTAGESFDVDAIVYATGFDAMTGAIVRVDITGRDGVRLADKWAAGPETYLGLTTVGFPNLFMITGPQSPSVLSNMAVSIEQHVDWVCDALADMRERGFSVIEPTPTAEAGWVQHSNDYGNVTLFPEADSWYMGANVAGKPRVFLPYIGGVDRYRAVCDEVVDRGYLGFELSGNGRSQRNDGVIRSVQPDVVLMLEFLEELGVPPVESMSAPDARALVEQLAAAQPPGPDVGEIVDGTLPGAEGELDYRLFRPATQGPHPVLVYFHGGGWVWGSPTSDEPFCRDLCVRADAVVVSVDYRHAPEAPFPAAVDDGYAAVRWVAANAERLGGLPGQLAVGGWSAGANVAAVACHTARDEGGPDICGQLLVNPVTDSDLDRRSYLTSGDGYILTKPLMAWFWDHYADPSVRTDPRAAPLRAESLAGLPPAIVVTCDFDPLRDEGAAYAEGMVAAGVPVRHHRARGQIHTSLTAVDVLVSATDDRAAVADALRELLAARVLVR